MRNLSQEVRRTGRIKDFLTDLNSPEEYEFDSLGEYVIESNRLGVPLYKRTLDYRRALRITVPNVEYEIIRLDEMEGPFLFWISTPEGCETPKAITQMTWERNCYFRHVQEQGIETVGRLDKLTFLWFRKDKVRMIESVTRVKGTDITDDTEIGPKILLPTAALI